MRAFVLPAFLLTACAASAKAPPTPSESAAAPPPGIPTTCAKDDAICVPDAGFVKRLCDASYPDVALVLLGKGTPFTRVYLRGEIDGWNAERGAGGGYLVMRWDGNCYTVDEGEVTTKEPPTARHAPIPWRFYGERTKDALLQSPEVLAAYQRRGKECKGATSGEVSRACEHADAALSAAVVGEVRGGKAVPTPEKMP